jgi:hypothetical protein
MTVRLNIAPATPARTEATPSPTDQRGAERLRREVIVLALRKLCTKHEPAGDRNQHKS